MSRELMELAIRCVIISGAGKLTRGRGLRLRPRRASERLPPSFARPKALQPVPGKAAHSARSDIGRGGRSDRRLRAPSREFTVLNAVLTRRLERDRLGGLINP